MTWRPRRTDSAPNSTASARSAQRANLSRQLVLEQRGRISVGILLEDHPVDLAGGVSTRFFVNGGRGEAGGPHGHSRRAGPKPGTAVASPSAVIAGRPARRPPTSRSDAGLDLRLRL